MAGVSKPHFGESCTNTAIPKSIACNEQLLELKTRTLAYKFCSTKRLTLKPEISGVADITRQSKEGGALLPSSSFVMM